MKCDISDLFILLIFFLSLRNWFHFVNECVKVVIISYGVNCPFYRILCHFYDILCPLYWGFWPFYRGLCYFPGTCVLFTRYCVLLIGYFMVHVFLAILNYALLTIALCSLNLRFLYWNALKVRMDLFKLK